MPHPLEPPKVLLQKPLRTPRLRKLRLPLRKNLELFLTSGLLEKSPELSGLLGLCICQDSCTFARVETSWTCTAINISRAFATVNASMLLGLLQL